MIKINFHFSFDNWRIEYGITMNDLALSRNAVIHEGYVRDILLHNIGYIDLGESAIGKH